MFVGESILCEGVSCFLDGGELLRGPEERVELPSLPSDVIIGRPQPWTVSVADLQLPHYLVAPKMERGEERNKQWSVRRKWKSDLNVYSAFKRKSVRNRGVLSQKIRFRTKDQRFLNL